LEYYHTLGQGDEVYSPSGHIYHTGYVHTYYDPTAADGSNYDLYVNYDRFGQDYGDLGQEWWFEKDWEEDGYGAQFYYTNGFQFWTDASIDEDAEAEAYEWLWSDESADAPYYPD
jgi:hypothetical protein